MGFAKEGEDVVLAEGVELDIFDNDELLGRVGKEAFWVKVNVVTT